MQRCFFEQEPAEPAALQPGGPARSAREPPRCGAPGARPGAPRQRTMTRCGCASTARRTAGGSCTPGRTRRRRSSRSTFGPCRAAIDGGRSQPRRRSSRRPRPRQRPAASPPPCSGWEQDGGRAAARPPTTWSWTASPGACCWKTWTRLRQAARRRAAAQDHVAGSAGPSAWPPMPARPSWRRRSWRYWLAMPASVPPLPVDPDAGERNGRARGAPSSSSSAAEETRGPAPGGSGGLPHPGQRPAARGAPPRASPRWTGRRTLLVELEGHGREDVVRRHRPVAHRGLVHHPVPRGPRRCRAVPVRGSRSRRSRRRSGRCPAAGWATGCSATSPSPRPPGAWPPQRCARRPRSPSTTSARSTDPRGRTGSSPTRPRWIMAPRKGSGSPPTAAIRSRSTCW